jgi:hypothetical protein
MMAESFFQRALTMKHTKTGGTLRGIGRNYLAKAIRVASAQKSKPQELAPHLNIPLDANKSP